MALDLSVAEMILNINDDLVIENVIPFMVHTLHLSEAQGIYV